MISGERWARLEQRFLPGSFTEAQHNLIEEISFGRWDYAVFIVRRSFLLALLTAKSMGIDLMKNTRCLTDSSFFVHMKEMADYFIRNGRFPSIVFVDDFIFKGRNLNTLLIRSEDYIVSEVKGQSDDIDEETIREEFRRSVSIRVNARVRGKNLLMTRYRDKIRTNTDVRVCDWHKISSDEALMLAMADTANASYTYSVGISEEEFRRIEADNDLIKTLYQGNKEYAYIDVGINDIGNVKYICSIRFIRVIESQAYRMIGFVMTPELSKDTRARIISVISERILNRKGYEGLYDFLNEKLASRKRSQDEWISLFFSCTMLCEFCKKYNIEVVDNEEIDKLVFNYRRPGKETDNQVRCNLLTMIKDPVFSSISELKSFLDEVMTEKEVITSHIYNRGLIHGREKVLESLEQLYYSREINELAHIVDVARNDPIVIGDVSGKTQFPTWLPIDIVSEGGGVEDVRYAMAYFLQMMDIGIHGVYAEDKRAKSNKSYNSYSKAAEMSLNIYPLRLYMHMPVIIAMYEHCELNHLNLLEHMDKYAASRYCDIADKMDEIRLFIRALKLIDETPYDWFGGYLYRMRGFDPDDITGNIELRQKKTETENKNLDCYRNFIRNTM